MTRISRRALIAGAGAAAFGSVALPSAMTSPESLDTTVPEDSWPMPGRDPGRTGYAPAARSPRRTPEVVWQRKVGSDDGLIDPVVRGDTAYATNGNRLVALDVDDGKERWRFVTDSEPMGLSPIDEGPVASGGSVQIGGDRLRAIDGGTTSWTVETPWVDATYTASLLPVGNSLFVGAPVYGSGPVTVFDVETGIERRRWAGPAPMAIGDGIVVGALHPAGGEPLVVGTDARTGELLWKRPWTDPTPSGLAVDSGRVYVCGRKTRALSLSDGSTLWTADVGGERVDQSPATDGEAVYLGDGNSNVYALDASDGSRRWTTFVDRSGDRKDAITVTDRGVYVPTAGGVDGLDPDTGDRLFRYRAEGVGEGTGEVVTAGSRLYVGIDDSVFALEGS